MFKKFSFILLFSGIQFSLFAQSGTISGTVLDQGTGESVIGANVVIEGTTKGAPTDIDGKFIISNVEPGSHNLTISFVGYTTKLIPVVVQEGRTITLDISLEEDFGQLEMVTITAVRETANDVAVLKTIKESMQIVSGLSAETIKRTLDSDVSQVVKRIPGITVVQDRFIVIRGLSERYNTTLLHNSNIPSMEQDVRSFSFDVIPSNVIDQILIYKTPAPDLPGDFSGGAVKIFTKSIPEENETVLDISTGFRSGSSLRNFRAESRRDWHWTGFNDGANDLPADFPENLVGQPQAIVDQAGRSLPNNWKEQGYNSGLDYKVSVTNSFRKNLGKKGSQIGNITSIQYSNTKTVFNVRNASFEAFNFDENISRPRFQFDDMEYSQEIMSGLVHNWAFRLDDNNIFEFKNLYNQLTTHDFIDRYGDQFAQSFTQDNFAFFNEYRGIYSGQLVGSHKFFNDATKIEWIGGYGLSFNELPDYRRYRRNVVDIETRESTLLIPAGQSPDFLGKFYSSMREDMITAAFNIEQTINKNKEVDFKPVLKAGIYFEDRDRNFSARNLGFRRGMSFTSELTALEIDEVFQPENINSESGIALGENFSVSNFFNATNRLRAYYISANIPIWRFNLFGGVRYEDNLQQLRSPDRFTEGSPTPPMQPVSIPQAIWLPSVTLAYNISNKMVVKGVYGKTVNRPEFREIAPFGFYNFIFDATVTGYEFLQNSEIDNFDLRWEWYPSLTETVSFALFYKDFTNPIESLFGNFGSEQTTFLYRNTESAYTMGFEVDVRKSLAGISNSVFLSRLSVLANFSYIDSEITLGEELSELLRAKDRPLQGQSNYIINTGIFYDDIIRNLQVNLLYNVIGKRILLVGAGAIPDTYEMPRNVIDLSIRKGITKRLALKFGIKDLLNQEFLLLQDGNEDGIFSRKNDQVFRRYRPGTSYSLGLTYVLK